MRGVMNSGDGRLQASAPDCGYSSYRTPEPAGMGSSIINESVHLGITAVGSMH